MALPMEKQIHLEHYALFREARGTSTETVVARAATPGELFSELGLDAVCAPDPAWLRVAVNDAFADWQAPLKPGDRVVFIAPVAGG